MHNDALQKAKDRFLSARSSLKNLDSSKDYASARRFWYEFLIASNGVFSVLEQGAKDNSKSNNWYAKLRRQRKDDQLLRYLHHARNADEHNVPSVTEHGPGEIVFLDGGNSIATIEEIAGIVGTFRTKSKGAIDLKNVNQIRIYPEHAKLIGVVDRGVRYEPPAEHLGHKIEDCRPAVVASLMIQFIEAMINDAEALSLQKLHR
jgi:hypothetical protein